MALTPFCTAVIADQDARGRFGRIDINNLKNSEQLLSRKRHVPQQLSLMEIKLVN